MNPYYHSFDVGFNWWMLYIPVSMIATAIIGWKATFHLEILDDFGDTHTFKVVPDKRQVIKLGIKVMAIIMGILLVVESFDGIIQLYDNLFGDGLMSVYLAICTIPVSIFVYWYILSVIRYRCSGKQRRSLRAKAHRFIREHGWKAFVEVVEDSTGR